MPNDAAAANPRRRGGSLERLKRRSASARWNELRQTWQLEQAESAHPAPSDQSEPARADSSLVATDRGGEDPNGEGSNGEGSNRAAEVSRTADAWQEPATGVAAEYGLPPLPATDSESHLAPSHAPADRPSFVAQGAPDGEGSLLGPDGARLRRSTAAERALPKPITAILPYYDYAPDGEQPCEYLCPRPEGCPADEGGKPCPERVALPDVSRPVRTFVDAHVLWEPSNLFHNPLYFEDHALERYGHTHHDLLQPLVSVGKFSVQLVGLPYQMALHPVHERQYTLGWHRPGECVPTRYYLPPWNTKAAIAAGGVYTGLIFLIP